MQWDPSSEATSHSAAPKNSHTLCNLKVHYIVHNSTPSDLIMSQMNPVYILHLISLISILRYVNILSMPGSPKWPWHL
jgi:hypothetical protein